MSSEKAESATGFRTLIVGIILLLAALCALVVVVRRRQESALTRANHNAILASLIDMATHAQAFYRTETGLGGGGRSFRGLDNAYWLTTYPDTGAGNFAIAGVTDSTVTLRDRGTRRNGTDSPVEITLIVRPDTFEILDDNTPPADPRNPGEDVANAVAYNRLLLDDAVRDNYQHVLQDLMELGDRAQRYYQESARSRNDRRSFRTLDTVSKLASSPVNGNGTYSIVAADDTSVVLQGTGMERTRQGIRLTVRVTVKPNRIDVVQDSTTPASNAID